MYILVTKVRSQARKISRAPLGVGDSTDQTSQANLRKLNFTNTIYQLAYYQVLLQHLNSVSKRTTTHPRTTMPLIQDTQLHIKQTLDTDPEINYINWELNVQDVASTTGRTIASAQGLLGLVLNTTQWNAHALNISINDDGWSTGDR